MINDVMLFLGYIAADETLGLWWTIIWWVFGIYLLGCATVWVSRKMQDR